MRNEDLLTIKEAADYLRVSKATLYRIVASKVLCILHLNGKGSARISRMDLEVYLDKKERADREAWKTGEPRHIK